MDASMIAKMSHVKNHVLF